MTSGFRFLISAPLAMLLGYAGFAEPFRTNVAAVVSVSASRPEGESAVMRYSDALAISLYEDSLFVQGIEIEIKIPAALQTQAGAIGWTLFKSVRPVPKLDKVSYEGDVVLAQVLPYRVSLVLQIPTSERATLRSGPYATVIPSIIKSRDFPVVFKLTPYVKGASPDIEHAEFKVRVRPILTDEGIVRLSISRIDGGITADEATVLIDDRRYERWNEPIYLKKGLHSIHIQAEGYRDEVRTVNVEPGKVSDIAVVLLDTKPLALFEAPANALVTLDGENLDIDKDPRVQLDAGEHVVVCRIGDYTITRKFIAIRGKTYRIVLSVDLQVLEGP